MARVRLILDYLRTFEPARLQALKASVYALLLLGGVNVPLNIDAKVNGVLALAVVLLNIYQGESTRAKVTPASVLPAEDYEFVVDEPDAEGA